MTLTPEQIAAYVDGELSEIEVRRVEKAAATDPALAAQIAAEQRLRATLAARFAPVADAPVPDRFLAMIHDDAKVVSFAEARDARRARRWLPDVRWGGAIAAALVAGVALGQFVPSSAPVKSDGGTLIASADLAKALDGSVSGAQGETRVLISFKDQGGRFCRGFESGALAGIACRDGARWRLDRTEAAGPGQATQYRQAGSAHIMAAAQDMAAGAPLDADQERAAIRDGWR